MKPMHSAPSVRYLAGAVTRRVVAICPRRVAIDPECHPIHSVAWEAARVVADGSTHDPVKPGHWHILERRLLVDRSPYAVIYDEDVQLPNGETVTNFTRIELPQFVIMVVLMEDGTVPVGH